MAKDPAFLFYPGDYLRDTQMLSEKSQVAYDRIMCEHMRNICISKSQLKFLTKRLNEEEKDELKMVLTEVKGGYQITWVKESIEKRRKYSDSRRKNRESNKKDMNNICKTYDSHMENENENEVINKIENRSEKFSKEVMTFTTFASIAKEFISYWTEPNKSKTKMRFELEKTWDTKRRLETWANRSKNFNGKGPAVYVPKSKTDEEIKQQYGDIDYEALKKRKPEERKKAIYKLKDILPNDKP